MQAAELAQTVGLSDVEVVAATLWGEARNQTVYGRIAIAHVIKNRMARRAQTAHEVCLAKLQFSCWWSVGGAANHAALLVLLNHLADYRDPVWLECLWVAKGVLDGVCRDVVKGADHYVTTTLLNSTARPNWVLGMLCIGRVGDHTFYRSNA